jgi:predicted HicB family RNase H-like nuclease
MKVKIFKPAQMLIGINVPTNQHGHAGRFIENKLEEIGVKVNRGHGPDFIDYGLELKTRAVDATSAQTVADMSIEDIIALDYKDSHVFKKFQQQLRVYIKDNIVVSADVYDFSHSSVQELIEQAYDHAKDQLIKCNDLTRTEYKDYYGYFEKVDANRKTFSFRLSKSDMEALEGMAKSNYKNLFIEE